MSAGDLAFSTSVMMWETLCTFCSTFSSKFSIFQQPVDWHCEFHSIKEVSLYLKNRRLARDRSLTKEASANIPWLFPLVHKLIGQNTVHSYLLNWSSMKLWQFSTVSPHSNSLNSEFPNSFFSTKDF